MTERRTRDEIHRRLTADEAEEQREHQAAEEAERKQAETAALEQILEHDRRVRRFLLRLSLANWGIAVVAWVISAFLGITSPASIIVYSVLFVIGSMPLSLAILSAICAWPMMIVSGWRMS